MRKRKDITPNESEKRKQHAAEASSSSSSMIGQITSRIAALTASRSRAPSVSSQASSATSYASTAEIKTGRTPMTELDEGGTRYGKFRDVVEVDVLFIDGKDYTSNMTEREAHKYVCKRGLGIKRERIHAVKILWRGHPRVVIRLKEKINIDMLPPSFEYDKDSTNSDGTITKQKVVCDVLGIRLPSDLPRTRTRVEESPEGPWVRWVKIEGTGFDTNRDKLKAVLNTFGVVDSPFETETITFQDDEPESGDDDDEPHEVTLATGKLSVKVIITEPIPQYIPCDGKKLKIHYRGI